MAELLRFATAGSVDDGKSHPDRPAALRLEGDLRGPARGGRAHQRARRGDEYTNLALLTDGLRAEREQGITIDVAYRYFATPRRKFIIADTPGHIQYTRNMVTGASTADLALILVDARKGMVEQSRRHAFLASLLRVPHLVLCVNKMDLVDCVRGASSSEIADEFTRVRRRSSTIADLTFIPISALHGDNVVTARANMPWYDGPSLLHHLEDVHIASRPQPDRRRGSRCSTSSGRIATSTTTTAATPARSPAASFKPGDEVMVLPSGFTTTIASIDTADGPVEEAFPPMSVTVRLDRRDRHLRGDMICRPHNQPHGRPGHRRDGLLDDRDAPLTARRQATRSSTPPARRGPWSRTCSTGSTSTRCTATRRRTRWRSTRSAGSRCAPRAAVRRRVPPQPHDRQLHPHRRGAPTPPSAPA